MTEKEFKIEVNGVIRPVNAIRCIELPWWIGTSFIKIIPHLRDKKGGKYNMNHRKKKSSFNISSHLSRQLNYLQFYR